MNKYLGMARKNIVSVTGLCLWLLLSAFSYKEADIEQTILPESFGTFLPTEGENAYTKAVRQAKEYKDATDALTYEMDYDGDGEREAFVIIGKKKNPEESFGGDFIGEAWFVNSEKEAVKLSVTSDYWQESEYVTIQGKTWILLNRNIGNPWISDVYTVELGKAVEVLPGGFKTLDDQGQILVELSYYDFNCMWEEPGEFLWTGHTWKNYTFTYVDGEFREIRGREISREELEEMGASMENIDMLPSGCLKQYILRENGELDVNMAEIRDYEVVFHYAVFQINEKNIWEKEKVEYGAEDGYHEGYYYVMLTEVGHDIGARASKILDFKCTLINCLQKLDILPINVGK